MNRSVAWAGCLLLGLVGCGGSTRPSTAPENPSESESLGTGQDTDGAPAQEYQQQQPAGYPGGGYAQPPPDPAAPAEDSATSAIRGAWDSFEAAATRLSQAGPDCRLACKALNSMRRSTERICALSESDGSDHCAKARRRLQDAEKRVESNCSCSETP